MPYPDDPQILGFRNRRLQLLHPRGRAIGAVAVSFPAQFAHMPIMIPKRGLQPRYCQTSQDISALRYVEILSGSICPLG